MGQVRAKVELKMAIGVIVEIAFEVPKVTVDRGVGTGTE
jgi:hypothetical protein